LNRLVGRGARHLAKTPKPTSLLSSINFHHHFTLSAVTGTPQGLKAIKKQRKKLKLKLLRNQKELSSNRIQFFLVSLVLILKFFS